MKRSQLRRTKPMKRSSINKRSSKRAAREREAAPVRLALVARTERCECCGRRKPANELAIHEIASGQQRQKALDKLYAVLVVCQLHCHPIVQNESKARQLARLWINRLHDFDLPAFLKLICRAPKAITFEEVMHEVDKLLNPES